jgi:high affinity sulfate transporter 1
MERALRLPLFDWLSGYQKSWLTSDVVAGLTTAAVVIPKAMAYATVAGLPIQIGLYTAFVPLIVYALLGTSRPLSVTTTTTLAILTAAELGEAVPNGDPTALLQATALLTLMVGAILMAASVLRLGFVANFISEPVLVGFKAGIGVVIIVDQLPKVLGMHFTKGSFLNNVGSIFTNLSHMELATLTVGVLTILGLVVIEKLRPRWPAPLVVIAAGIAAAALFALQDRGISLVGAIPAGLPAFRVPDFTLAQQLWPGALGMALMSFTETIAAGRAFAKSDEPPLRPNVELFATGAANAVGAFLGCMPGGGGTSQTAVNRLTGARTQVASVVTALMTLLTMLFLAPLIALMPNAVLAGVVIFYSVGLIKLGDFRNILRIRRTEFVWAVAAFLGVMVFGTLKGILVAIIVSLVALAQQVANPPVFVLGRKPGTNVFRPRSPEHPEDESYPGLLMLRMEGRLFFLNAERIAEKVRTLTGEAKPKVVLMDLSAVFDLEYSALKMLIDAEKRSRDSGVSLWLAGLSSEVYAMVQRSALGAALGSARLFFNLELAVDKYRAQSKFAGAANE